MMKKTFIFCTIIFLVSWIIGFCIFAWQINHFTIDTDTQTDAIIALTGGRNRILEAAKLFETGKAERLFISGVGKDISLQNIQKTQQVSIADENNVDIGHEATNTVENAKESAEWVRQNHIKSIRLVTSNYHIFRSLIEFRAHNPNLTIILHPVYSENIEKKWWTSWQTSSLIFKEYNKFLYAYVRNLF